MRNMIFRALGIVAGLTLIVMGGTERWNIYNLRSLDQRAVAVPTYNYSKHTTKGGFYTDYSSHVTFRTQSGQRVEEFKVFSQEVHSDFQSRVPVIVYYDPKDPGNFIFHKERNEWIAKFGFGIALLLGSYLYLGRDRQSARNEA